MSGGPFLGPPARRRRRGRAPRILLLVLVVAAATAGIVVAVSRGGGTDRRGAKVMTFQIKSRLVGRTLDQKAAVPATGSTGRPLLVLLHGRGSQPGDAFSQAFFTELDRLGARAPVVVAVNGGAGSYYHDRDSGRWGSYVVREAIPAAVERFHTDPGRTAIGGMSMGGFGALDIARDHPRRFCAVGGHSAALWLRSGDSAPGAFDDERDFARHDMVAYVRKHKRAFAGESLWLDVGRGDPFRKADTTLVRALKKRRRDVTWHVWPGGHDASYWNDHIADYLRFYATALQRC